MLKLFLVIILVLLIIVSAFSQSSLNGNESYYEKDHVLFQHTNDINMLYSGSKTDDRAFTSSFLLKAFLNRKEQKNSLLSFGIRTDLYTQKAPGHYFDENNRYFPYEYFTEISSIEFSLVKFMKNNFAFQWSGGVGILNQEKPITGLALWVQGGSDGSGGFHKLLDNWGKQHGQVNVERDKIAPFVYIQPAVSYFVNVFPQNKELPHTLVSELGVNLCSNLDGSWMFFNNRVTAHVLQFMLAKRMLLLDFIGAGDFKLHEKGYKFDARVGGEISWGKIALGYEMTKQIGEENINWVDFIDNDEVYRIYFKVRLKKQKVSGI